MVAVTYLTQIPGSSDGVHQQKYYDVLCRGPGRFLGRVRTIWEIARPGRTVGLPMRKFEGWTELFGSSRSEDVVTDRLGSPHADRSGAISCTACTTTYQEFSVVGLGCCCHDCIGVSICNAVVTFSSSSLRSPKIGAAVLRHWIKARMWLHGSRLWLE